MLFRSPLAPATLTLRFDLDQASALRRLNDWAGQPLPLNASAWWDGMLVLRLAGAAAAVQSACDSLGGERIELLLAAHGLVDSWGGSRGLASNRSSERPSDHQPW